MTTGCKFYQETVEGSINSEKMVEIFDRFSKTIVKKTVVVLDNAPIHRSKLFASKLKGWREQDLYIYFIPPYSPELNLIEILWRFIKYKWLSFEAYIDFESLKLHLKNVLDNIGLKYSIKFL